MFFGALAGLLTVALAIKGTLRILFLIWSFLVFVLLVKGYMLSGYKFQPQRIPDRPVPDLAALLIAVRGLVSDFAASRRGREKY